MRATAFRVTALRTAARVLTATAVAFTVVGALALPAAAADDVPTGGTDYNMSVPVIGSAPPATSPTDPGGGASGGGSDGNGGGGSSSGGSAGGSGSGGGTGSDPVDTGGSTPQPAADDVLIAGGLYLSAVGGTARPTVNPFEGTTELWVTLRNLSTETIDATADFSIATVAGAPISATQVAIDDLKPAESRVVGTTLRGSGQWPFVAGSVTITPPDKIDDQDAAPVTRATLVFVFPWLLVIALILVALAVVLQRLSVRVTRPALEPVASPA